MTRGAASGRVAAALLLLAGVRLAILPLYPLMDTTEARYADIVRQMVVGGDWLTPRFSDGQPFWGKPPLAFWLSALPSLVTGATPFAVRVPHWALGVGLAVLVWRQGRRESRRGAWHAAALLGGSALFLAAAGAVMTDMALALGCALVMIGFLRAMDPAPGTADATTGPGLMLAGACIGLLAKGPVLVLLAGAPIFAWSLWARRAGDAWRRVPWLRGAALAAVVVAPWYLLAEARTPGFLAYFLVGEHWSRFVTAGWQGDRYGVAHAFPRGTIWLFAALATLPWTLLAPLAWLARRRATDPPPDLERSPRHAGYWVAWALAPLLVFTFAGNILWTYALPCLAPLALACGARTARLRPPRTVDTALAGSLLGWCVALAVALPVLHARGDFERLSTAWIVELARNQPDATTSPLFFVGDKLPYSASYYSGATAQRIGEVDALALACPAALVAVPVELVHSVAAPGRETELLGAGRRHALLRMRCIPRDPIASGHEHDPADDAAMGK